MALHEKYLVSGYLIAFLTFIVKVSCILRSDCPLGCECLSVKMTVICKFWDELPPLPKGTKEFYLKYGNVGILKRPQSCYSYNEVINLNLNYNNIREISVDVFVCVPKLQHLEVDEIDLRIFPKHVEHFTPMIENVLFYSRQLDITLQVIPMICELLSLNKLDLKTNHFKFTRKSLICLKSLLNLSYVDLSYNFISEPVAEVLEPLKHVSKFLGLQHCRISSLKEETFKGFQLERLDLSDNQIHHIAENSFINMKHMKILSLNYTYVNDTQRWLKNTFLEVIDLSSNRIEFENVPSLPNLREINIASNEVYRLTHGFVSNFNRLKTIDMSACNIIFVERHALHNLPKLEVLDLGSNSINNSNLATLLSDLTLCPLKRLNLKLNPLVHLNGTFDEFPLMQLEILILRQCVLTELLPKIFKHLKCLSRLDLSVNKFEQLSSNVFQDLNNLTYLNLEENKLIEFDTSSLGLQSTPLVELKLRRNRISALIVQNISTLTHLDLSQNCILIKPTTFENLISLKELVLWVSLKEKDQFITGLSSLPKLARLDMSGNYKTMWMFFSPRYFWPTPNLEILEVSDIKLDRLNPQKQKELFGNLTRLRKLNINGCLVSVLLPGMFETLSNLETLKASSNKIYLIESSAFWNLSNLIDLFLRDNFITHVNWETFTSLPNLRTLSLSGNPLLCTCDVLWLYQAITTHNLVSIIDPDQHICVSPADVATVQVNKLNWKKSHCEYDWLLILKPICYGLAIIVAVFLIRTMWRYRWQIRYTCFLAKAGQGRYEELHDDKAYVYDAFVAYSSKDLSWVTQQLMPNIDSEYIGEMGFKLCVHERDWLAGDIVENIMKSITESRRTILVLSEDFAKSRWCQFELAMVHLRLNAEGHRKGRLIIILLGNIPDHLLSPRIVYLLSNKTYLTWPKDPNGEHLFWKTLGKSMRQDLLYTTAV